MAPRDRLGPRLVPRRASPGTKVGEVATLYALPLLGLPVRHAREPRTARWAPQLRPLKAPSSDRAGYSRVVDFLARIAEARIAEAIERGDFDDLPGKGRPLELEDLSRLPADMRLSYKILRNAEVV